MSSFHFLSFRPGMLKPVIGVVQGLTDPVSGMIMGNTAEVLAREFNISRDEQDEYALLSHQRAVASRDFLAGEIIPVPIPPTMKMQETDDVPRVDQSMQALKKLRPYFDRVNGTVTVGNACPLTDGGCALLLMHTDKAKELGLKPIGYLRGHAYAGLEPERMGLGPVYATAKLLDKTGISVSDFDAIELNEAFAAQVIANERAFNSDAFSKEFLNRDKALGEIDRTIMNSHGGAIALGHPVGMTGARLVLTVLRTLIENDKELGLATMCIGGGQGGALAIERA